MESILQLNHINKSYGTLQVLKDVSLTVNRGELLAIVGPSGAGKTTLLQIAGTLDRPDTGSVIYEQEEVMRLRDRRLSAFRNANIGFIFQFHRLLPEFSALENVMMPALIGGQSKRKARSHAAELLELMGLSDRASHRPAQMSGGECQRVAVARALINNPKVVLADEPTGNLDGETQSEILKILRSLASSGKCVILVTHSPEVARMSDYVYELKKNRIFHLLFNLLN